MKKFTMPSDFKKETIDQYYLINDKYADARIIETYGQMTELNLKYSGRSSELLPTMDYSRLEEYVNYSLNRGIEFNYTLNASCMGNFECSINGQKEIKELVMRLYNMGIDTFTVTLPAIMEIILDTIPKANIVVSTICEVNSVSKVNFYKKMGAKRIVVDADITRNLTLLKIMKENFEGIEIMLNNMCMKDCIYKKFHYNHDSHYIDEHMGSNYYLARCIAQKYSSKENVLKLNWVRPEDINLYQQIGIDIYKIQGRTCVVNGQPWKAVEAYINESYVGNLSDLLMVFSPSPLSTYIDNKKLGGFLQGFCLNRVRDDLDCERCDYCKKYAENSVEVSEFSQMILEVYKNMKLF